MVAKSGGAKKIAEKVALKCRNALNSDKAKKSSSNTKESSKSPVKFVVHPQTRNKIAVHDNNNNQYNNDFTTQEIKLPKR